MIRASLFPLAALLVVLPASAEAQRNVRVGGGAGFFYVGTGAASLGDLNTELTARGFPEVDETGVSIGGGGYGIVGGRFLIGGQGHGVRLGSEATGGREVTISGGYGLFDVGYVFPVGTRAIVYPMVGIGGGAIEALVEDRDGTGLGPNVNDPTFGEVLDDPGRRSRLNRATTLLNVGLGFDLPLTRPTGGLMLSVRGGYLFAAGEERWQLYDTGVIGGPDASMDGPYVRIGIGGGRLSRR